jgi:hypothetical protein
MADDIIMIPLGKDYSSSTLSDILIFCLSAAGTFGVFLAMLVAELVLLQRQKPTQQIP